MNSSIWLTYFEENRRTFIEPDWADLVRSRQNCARAWRVPFRIFNSAKAEAAGISSGKPRRNLRTTRPTSARWNYSSPKKPSTRACCNRW